MIRIQLEVLNLLFTVQHLPALYAEYLTVRLGFNGVQSVDEGVPLLRMSLYHT